jgi:hypothetical protein
MRFRSIGACELGQDAFEISYKRSHHRADYDEQQQKAKQDGKRQANKNTCI